MNDVFDAFFNAPTQASSPSAAKYSAAPEGEHEVEIVAAKIADVPWKKSDANPSGQCLSLRLSAGKQFSLIFADIPKERAAIFRALSASLSQANDAGPDLSIGTPDELVGRTAMVEIGRYETRQGETRACVRKWLARAAEKTAASKTKEPPQRAASAARRTAAQRITKQLPDEDDIPF